MRRRLLVLVATLSTLAAAQDGGARFGLAAGAPLGPLDRFLDTPLWVDSSGHVFSQLPNQQGVRCYATDGGTPTVLGQPGPLGDLRVFAREGSDTLFFMALAPGNGSASFSSSTCSGPSQALGSVSLPPQTQPWGGVHAVDVDGALLYASPSGVLRVGFSPTPALSVLVSKAELVTLLGALPDAGLADDPLTVVAVRRNAVGALVLIVERRDAAGPLLAAWVVERSPGGALSVRWGPDQRLARQLGGLVDWPSAGFSVFTGYTRSLTSRWSPTVLGLVPHTAALEGRVPPWPSQPAQGAPLPAGVTWLTTIGSSGGAPWAVGDAAGQLFVYPLAFDRAAADFDRDGLRASLEQSLGTSDFSPDTDHDGVPDGVERALFSTDPASLSSAPDAGVDERTLAPSYLARHWPELPEADCVRPTPQSWGREICFSARVASGCALPPSTFTCLDDQLRPLPGSPFASSLSPRFTASGARFTFDGASQTWQGAGGRAFPAPFVGDSVGLIPLSATHALFVDTVNKAVWRSDGTTPFAVVSRERAACPILANAAARCADVPGPLVEDVMPVGFDAARGRAVFVVTTQQSRFLLGVGEDDVAFMGDVLDAAQGVPVEGLVAMPGGGGWVLQVSSSEAHGSLRLDEGLSARGPFQPPLVTTLPLPPMQGALRDTTFEQYFLEPVNAGPGACLAGGWGDTTFFICDVRQDNPPPMLVTHAMVTRWVPVGPAVEKGEVLLWSYARYRGQEAASFLSRDGGYEPGSQYLNPGWLLWRYTPEGAVAEWLTGAEFAALLSPNDRALLATTPLGDILDMGASADGTRVCLAEPGAGRVWELVLDATSRRLTQVRLAASGGATACAYADDGTLAWVGGAPVTFHQGARAVQVGVTQATGLLRARGQFVVQADGEPVRCVRDDDTVAQGTVTMTAMGEALGDVAWIADLGDAGIGVLGTADRLCSGGGATESFLHPAVPFWTGIYNPLITPRTANAAHGSLAVRPDGLLLVAPRDIAFTGLGGTSRTEERPVVKNYFFHVFPRYQRLGAERLAQLDAFRLRREVISLGARNVLNVGAMVLIPGADAGRDWGYRVRPGDAGEAPVVDAGPSTAEDAGSSAPPPPGPTPPGCGCASADVGAVLLAALISLLRAARR